MNDEELQKITESLRKASIKNEWLKLFDIQMMLPQLIKLAIQTSVVVFTLKLLAVL